MARTPRGRGPRPTGNRPPADEPKSAAGNDVTAVEGRVLETLPNAMYAVELTNGQKVLSRIAGGLKTRGMRVIPGDLVMLELSPYDLTRGRITRRLT